MNFLSKCLIGLTILTGAANAELRIINASGNEVTVDVLSQKGQTQGTKFGAEVNSGQVLGPKMPRQQDVMVVVHGPDGSEAYREQAKSDEILVLHKWNPYLFNHAGWMGGKPSNSYPHVVNGLGQKVEYEITYADFSVYKNALEGPDGNTTAQHNDIGRAGSAGDVLNVKFTATDGTPAESFKMTAGVVYFLSKSADGKLKVEKLGTN